MTPVLEITQNSLLKQVSEYYVRGWSLIPIPYGTKEARIKWSAYQTERPSMDQLESWFDSSHSNIAVILGEVSCGLTCCDFDRMDIYEAWAAEYPDLAAELPTVKTSRGRHVYFRSEMQKTLKLDGIDMKASGYTLLPPSMHPDGSQYSWIYPLPVGEELPLLNPEDLLGHILKSGQGPIGTLTEQSEHTEQREHIEQTNTIELNENVLSIINKTLPQKFGTRNHQIFYLALGLKNLPGHWEDNPTTFKPVVWQWFERALPMIRTRNFPETWDDFLTAWENIKYRDIDPRLILNLCEGVQPPSKMLEEWQASPELLKLCVLCKLLHQSHAAVGSTAYLSVRTISELLGISPETAARYMRLLSREGYIQILEKGKMQKDGTGKATRFKYIYPQEDINEQSNC